MSARFLNEDVWEIQFAYPGKTRRHWRSVLITTGTKREVEREAEHMFGQAEYLDAVDLLVVPIDSEERAAT